MMTGQKTERYYSEAGLFNTDLDNTKYFLDVKIADQAIAVFLAGKHSVIQV